MISNLKIQNFKSIKDLSIGCRKLNILIGEPNSGKSNIIEALALQSQGSFDNNLNKDIFRYKVLGDLFYDFAINKPVRIVTDNRTTELKYALRKDGTPENQFHFLLDSNGENMDPLYISHEGNVLNSPNVGNTNVHIYEFKRLEKFSFAYLPHLAVPFGENLPSLLLSNEDYKKWVSEFLQSNGLKLTLKPTENDLAVSKLVGDEIYSYPYLSLSETLQRIIFYIIALKSNKDSVLLLDEPESNTFPYYTKFLAERIALDKTNQFFIATHNPYLLLNLIEKTKESDLNVCLVQMEKYQTIVNVLNKKQISHLIDLNSDLFFNFKKVLEQ